MTLSLITFISLSLFACVDCLTLLQKTIFSMSQNHGNIVSGVKYSDKVVSRGCVVVATSNIYCAVCLPLFSRLYKSLEDYDVVRGIFGGKVGAKSITCTALQAEANTDLAEAVKLYNEVC